MDVLVILPGTIKTAAAAIEAAGGQALGVVCDIRDEQQVIAAVGNAVEPFGGIDICINNASAIALTGTLKTDMSRYDLMISVNARGTFLCSKLTLPHLLEAENPHILISRRRWTSKPNGLPGTRPTPSPHCMTMPRARLNDGSAW